MTGVQFPAGAGIFFSLPPCPDWPWVSPSLIYRGYWRLFPHGWVGPRASLDMMVRRKVPVLARK